MLIFNILDLFHNFTTQRYVKMPNAETFPLLFAETIPPIAHPAHPVPAPPYPERKAPPYNSLH